MMTRTRVRMLAVAIAMVVSAAACGGESDPPTAAEDKATAERIVLTSSDMFGYTAEPTDNAEGTSSLDDCIKDNPLMKPGDNPRGVEGTDFGKDDGNVHVGSGAALAEKEADAEKALSAIETTLAGQCVKDGLKAAIEDDAPRGLRVGDVSSSALPSLDVTDDSVVTRLTVPMTALGDDVSLYLDLTYLREGRTLGGLVTLQTGSPFPDAERIRLSLIHI